ncbi:MAG: HAD-IA family hydrolase [Pseudomonadota bacterium]
MSTKALLFGSIGVLAETSDIQRRAYNQAFEDKGVNWHWDATTYRYLLQFVGGQARMKLLSDATGGELSFALIADIHAYKTRLAATMVQAEVHSARPGIVEAIAAAKQAGASIGIVTSTQMANIEAVAGAAGLDMTTFDVIISQEDGVKSKPDPAPYKRALERLAITAENVVAIEDTASSAQSAIDAGLETIVTPGAYALQQDFRFASHVVPTLLDPEGDLVDPLVRALLAVPSA